jgi:hypothetical protein
LAIAPTAAAFQLQGVAHHLEALAQFGDRQLHRLVDQPVDLQRPAVRPDVGRRDAVVADEVAGGRGDVVVQQVRGRLRVDRPVVEDAQAVLAGDREAVGLLGERGRDQARWHGAVERDCRAHDRAHRRQARPAQETAPVGVCFTAEDQLVGDLRILLVEFTQSTFTCLTAHRVPPRLTEPFWVVVIRFS